MKKTGKKRTSHLILAPGPDKPGEKEVAETADKPPELTQHFEQLRETALMILREMPALDQFPKLDVEKGLSFYEEVRKFEEHLIRRALRITAGNQARASRLLGLGVTTLNTMIKRYNISPYEFQGESPDGEETSAEPALLREEEPGFRRANG